VASGSLFEKIVLNLAQLMFSSSRFRTAHRHLMTSDLAPTTNFCLIKRHILMIVNLSLTCCTDTAIDYCILSEVAFVSFLFKE